MNKIFSKRLSGLVLMSTALLISIPTVSACYTASGKQVSCSSPSCDPGFTSANGRQCSTPTPVVINPTPTPTPTPIVVIPIGDDFNDPQFDTGPPPGFPRETETIDDFIDSLNQRDIDSYLANTEPPYYISRPAVESPARQLQEFYDNRTTRERVQDLYGNVDQYLWLSDLPPDLRWMEDFFQPGPIDPSLFESFDELLEIDWRLESLYTKDSAWKEWMRGNQQQLRDIREKLAYGLLESDLQPLETREEAVERLAQEDLKYKELKKIVDDNENESGLTENEKTIKGRLEAERRRWFSVPFGEGGADEFYTGDPSNSDQLSNEEQFDYLRFRAIKFAERGADGGDVFSVQGDTGGVLTLP